MRTVDWYFDYLSPYSYLQTFRFDELPEDVEIRFRPVLLAGLLNHWGTSGPAEVPPKKTHLFRHLKWVANQMGVAFEVPAAIPFNPLRALRLSIALGSTRGVVDTLFTCVWQKGLRPDDSEGWRAMAAALGVEDADARIREPGVKETLLANGEDAIAAGVFGVPTFVADGITFWGIDTTDFFLDYLRDPTVIDPEFVRRVEALRPSARRRA